MMQKFRKTSKCRNVVPNLLYKLELLQSDLLNVVVVVLMSDYFYRINQACMVFDIYTMTALDQQKCHFLS